MTRRTTVKTITFIRPFTLRGRMDGELPAGPYTVETDEELIEPLSFIAYRCMASRMHMPLALGEYGPVEMVVVDPDELSEAEGWNDGSDGAGGKDPSCSCWPLLQEPARSLLV